MKGDGIAPEKLLGEELLLPAQPLEFLGGQIVEWIPILEAILRHNTDPPLGEVELLSPSAHL